MATTLNAENPRVVAGPPLEKNSSMYIKTGQSWNAGQFLYVDTAGLLNACASDADAGTGGIKYIAMDTVTDPGNDTTTADVGVLTRDHILEGNELDGTVARTNLGNYYALNVTSNVCTVDVGDTGNDAFEIVDLGYIYDAAQYNSTDVKGKVRFKILTTVLEAAPA